MLLSTASELLAQAGELLLVALAVGLLALGVLAFGIYHLAQMAEPERPAR